MPATLGWDEFLAVVREAGIVDELSLKPFLEKWNQASSQSRDTGQFAESMRQAGLITSFQKKNLLEGKKRGYIIAEKYILLEHLGAGGMGSVWLCEHKVMRRRVAIKVLPTAFGKDPEYLARFHREARAVAALDDPNIVRAFDVDHDDKMHFLVMEYVDGNSFQGIVDDKGPLGIQQAADYISQAASGLQHAHEAGLVHRDIKPGNLLVDRKGTVKILDMGLALFFQEGGKSLTQQYDANAVLGTAEYLAPEQAVDSHGVDIRADIYSLGLTFYFLLTGKSPYGEEGTIAQKLIWHQLRTPKSVKEFRPEVSDGLEAVIKKMLAKDRADRYQTPDEVVKALTPWVRGTPEPKTKQPISPAAPPAKKGPETVHAADAETLVGTAEDRSTGSGVRSGKKARSDPHGPEGKRKAAKSAPAVEEPEVLERPKGKKASGKQRGRKAESTRFWIVMAGVGSGVLLLGLVILVVVLMKKPAEPSPDAGVAQLPKQKTDPVEVPQKPPQKDPEKKVEPPKKDTPPPPPDTKKLEPPKKESLAGFFPKQGTTLLYNMATYGGGPPPVQQQKWEFKEGVIDVSILKLGVIEKDTLLGKGKLIWVRPLQGKDQGYFRTTQTHFEIGQVLRQTNSVVWEPVLPVAAAEKDTWKWQFPTGETKEYAVMKFGTHKGKRAVIIQDSIPVPGGKVVTQHTYVQGIGEVAKTQSLEKMNSPPQLLAETMLVED